jgi:hypothetical protein
MRNSVSNNWLFRPGKQRLGPPAEPLQRLDIPSRQTAANLSTQKLSWYVPYSFLAQV